LIQGGRGARLTLETLDQLPVLSHFRRKEFQGDTTSESRVFGLIDHTHAAATELSCDLVV